MTNKRIPVGSVIAFWGSRQRINDMKRYELCDGEEVSTNGPLKGTIKPDLRARFIRGVPEDGEVDINSPTIGGNDFSEQVTTSGTSLTIDQMPRHTHVLNDPGHDHSINVPGNAGQIYDNGDARQAASFYSPGAQSTGATGTNITVNESGGDNAHSHSVPSFDNRPEFMEMHYIIRVK